MSKYNYSLTTLENGTKVLCYQDNNVNGINIVCEFDIGAIDENVKNNGVSHAVEHLVFKGTQDFPSKKELLEFQDKFAIDVQNGQTSNLYTSYYSFGINYDLENILYLLSQFTMHPLLRESDWEIEKNVILDEILRKYERMDYPLYKMLSQKRFKKKFNFLSLDASGTKESVSNLNIEDIVEHHKKYYTPENMTVFAAGNINIEKLHEYILKYFPKQEEVEVGKRKNREMLENDKNIYSDLFIDSIYNTDQRSYIALCFPAFSISEDIKARMTANYISTFLTNRDDSYLWKSLREEKGLVYGMSSGIDTFKYFGIFSLYLSFNPIHTEEIIKDIFDALKKLKDGMLDKNILETEIAKRNKKTLLNFDTVSGAINWLIDEIDEPIIRFPEDYIKIRNSITISDLQDIIYRILDWNKVNIGYQGPKINSDINEIILNHIKQLTD